MCHNVKQEIRGKRCRTCKDKVTQVPICIEKDLFCSIEEIDGFLVRKMDKVENLECLYQGDGIYKKNG